MINRPTMLVLNRSDSKSKLLYHANHNDAIQEPIRQRFPLKYEERTRLR